ncbi:MAG TPA: transposase [Paraburkholderia sp.]|nr:transposase [Paraburkholderia sp.]
MFYDELTNDEWALLAALVSDEPAVRLNRRGRPRAEPRIVANAVLWILTTGEPWSKLPGRYPSGPTCRRRFEEWQLNGTLLEMVRLLSQTGRVFAYIPQPAPPVAAKPAAPVVHTPSVREEATRGVSWKRPESWQAPHAPGNLNGWRPADPMADITRQLSGLANMPPPVSRTPVARPAMRATLPRVGEAVAVGAAMNGLQSAVTEARMVRRVARSDALVPAPVPDSRTPLPASLAPRGTPIAERNGYLIYVDAESVPNALYRAWAEIMKDGKRVERSGLVGPRFEDERAAQQYALEWAHQWIDRECRTQAATHAAPASAAGESALPVAQPLPPMRHVPEPVTKNHGGPLHTPLHTALHAPLDGPINAFRGPLRRYPAEPGTPATASDNTTPDYFPSYPELISHAG